MKYMNEFGINWYIIFLNSENFDKKRKIDEELLFIVFFVFYCRNIWKF